MFDADKYARMLCMRTVPLGATQILEETSSVSLHSKEIYISEASFVPAAAPGKPLEASAISFDLKLSTATFAFPEPLAKGKGTLKLSFQCDINNQVGAPFVREEKEKGWEGKPLVVRQGGGKGNSRCGK